MANSNRATLAILGLLFFGLPPALACSLCGSLGDQKTFRQDAGDSKLILYGVLEKPSLNADGTGTTQFVLAKTLKSDPILGDKKTLEVPRYIPSDNKKDPPRYLLFCDVFKGKIDFFRGVPVKSDKAVDYIKGLLAIDPKDRSKLLLHCFDYLEIPDKEIAFDAYLEFAKASDEEIGKVTAKLSAVKLRGWLKDPQTPQERLGLYAFMLGGCGKHEDADYLRKLLDKPTERTSPALDGILDGYIQMRPKEGWEIAMTLLRDDKKPFPVRFAVVRSIRLFHNWKPDDNQEQVLRGMLAILEQGDLADLAITDLTRWKMWDLTKEVLALYGKKTHDSPIVHRAILRYALTCPKDAAAAFMVERKKAEPDLVAEVEDGLQFEKKK